MGNFNGAPLRLHNRYFVMRHGRSAANDAGLIVSDPEKGIPEWGLAPGAGEEVNENLTGFPDVGIDAVFTSPFRRARETAGIAARRLGCPEPEAAPALRERWFGGFDGDGDHRYREVWKKDRQNVDNEEAGVESPRAVYGRLKGFLAEVEALHEGRCFLLVSHGDPLDILITAASGRPLTLHMEAGLKTAGIRELDTRELP